MCPKCNKETLTGVSVDDENSTYIIYCKNPECGFADKYKVGESKVIFDSNKGIDNDRSSTVSILS